METKTFQLPLTDSHALTLNQGSLVPVDVTWVDGNTHLQQFVGDKSIWTVVQGVLDEALEFTSAEVASSVVVALVSSNTNVPCLTWQDVNVRVQGETRLEVHASWVWAR